MTPKLKRLIHVMVSSTSLDLPKHRDMASRAISLHDMNFVGMEKLPSSGRDAIDASYLLVDKADIYVGIFGLRYGHIPKDDDRNPNQLSITELEYRRAKKRGIPIFCFLMHKKHPSPPTVEELETFIEASPDGKIKLEALKTEISDKGVKWFENPDMLHAQIFQAIQEAINDGTIQLALEGDAPPENPDSVLLPTPPTPYEPHPYRLTQKFFGRAGDLKILDEWSASTDAVMVVEAIGGVGKSALTYEWFTGHAKDFDGALWWSFYENESSMRRFVRHALAYLLHKPIDQFKNDKDSDLEAQLLALLNQKRVLVVFDGLERAMVAYHRLDAAQTSDDTAEDVAKAEDVALRKLTDQREADFLRKLAAVRRSKILVSTRLNPSDLQDNRKWRTGVRGLHLNGLQDTDALNLIRHYDVKGDTAKLTAFMKQFDNHCLLIKIVAGLVNDYPAAPNDFDQWILADGARLKVSDFNLKQNRTNILAAALNGLKPELAKLLSQIAAFRFPVDYAAVKVFNPYSDIVQFHKALRELEDRGLVAWDRSANTYDLHPVVRAYAFESMGEDARVETFDRIRSHFDGLPPEKLDEVTEVHQLHRSIEIYTALVRAGQLDSASDFYGSRLRDILLYQVAAYHTIVELLTPLFRDGLTKPPTLSTPSPQSARMTDIANAFLFLGKTNKASHVYEAKLKLNLEQKDAGNLAVGLLNYGNTLRNLNQIRRAEVVWGLALQVAEANEDVDNIAFGHQRLFRATSERGAWAEAEHHYQAFMAKPPTSQTEFWTSSVERNYAEMLLARGMLVEAEAPLERASSLALKSRDALEQRVIFWLRGELALRRGKEQAEIAIGHFNESVRRSRAAGANSSRALGGLARAYLAAGKPDEARKLVEEGITRIDAAEVWLGLGEREKAQERGLAAYEYGWADGPPYIYWETLERAKKVLDALGVPYPDLPPYDPSKQEPIPYEAEIRAFIEELKSKRRTRGDS